MPEAPHVSLLIVELTALYIVYLIWELWLILKLIGSMFLQCVHIVQHKKSSLPVGFRHVCCRKSIYISNLERKIKQLRLQIRRDTYLLDVSVESQFGRLPTQLLSLLNETKDVGPVFTGKICQQLNEAFDIAKCRYCGKIGERTCLTCFKTFHSK